MAMKHSKGFPFKGHEELSSLMRLLLNLNPGLNRLNGEKRRLLQLLAFASCSTIEMLQNANTLLWPLPDEAHQNQTLSRLTE